MTNNPLYKSYKGHNLEILHENDYLIVLNKPYDIKLEKGIHDEEYPSVEHLLRQQRKLDLFRVCGQLDYATSGILIIAKNKLSSNIINFNIESKKVSKIYLAIVYGHLPLEILHVTAPISKVKNDFKMKLCNNYGNYYEGGKFCYSVIYPYKHSFINQQKVTLCEMRTVTGRRHQLRLHSLSIGTCIVGDETYFEDMIINKYQINKLQKETEFKRIETNRMMLHCWILIKSKNCEKIENSSKYPLGEKRATYLENMENKIFDKEYIICNDILSSYVQEKKRTYEECVLKNDEFINYNFVNYNVQNIRKAMRKAERQLNREMYDHFIRKSLENQEKKEIIQKKTQEADYKEILKNEEEPHKNDHILNEIKKSTVHQNNLEYINVTNKNTSDLFLKSNTLYKVHNENYVDPNEFFDDIQDDVHKFNWG